MLIKKTFSTATRFVKLTTQSIAIIPLLLLAVAVW